MNPSPKNKSSFQNFINHHSLEIVFISILLFLLSVYWIKEFLIGDQTTKGIYITRTLIAIFIFLGLIYFFIGINTNGFTVHKLRIFLGNLKLFLRNIMKRKIVWVSLIVIYLGMFFISIELKTVNSLTSIQFSIFLVFWITIISLGILLLFFFLFISGNMLNYFSKDSMDDPIIGNHVLILLFTPVMFISILFGFLQQENSFIPFDQRSVKSVLIVVSFLNVISNFYSIYRGIEMLISKKDEITKNLVGGNYAIKIIHMLITWFIIIFLNSFWLIFLTFHIDNTNFLDSNGNLLSDYFGNLLYYTVTLLTVGYSDITPQGFGKLASAFIQLLSFFYTVIAIGGILSSNSSSSREEND